MNLRRSLHTNKGYTLIELMITLFIFAIITMFGVPAFYEFIEQSRAKSQMVKAANFLRSAQEIATSTNRIVYVYTAGYFDYNTHKDDYWTQEWIMSFKPIGTNHIRISAQDLALEAPNTPKTPNSNYLISQQTIFTASPSYTLNVLTSLRHNAIDQKTLDGSKAPSNQIEMEGYSYVREKYPTNPNGQGSDIDKPTYLIFYPSGAIVMPIFILAEERFNDLIIEPSDVTQDELNNTIGILGGCRLGGGLTIDSVNYLLNQRSIISIGLNIFTTTPRNNTSGSPPSFASTLCGSSFLQ